MYSRVLAALCLLQVAADPPVNVELPPAAPAWVDMAVPVGAVKLTAKNAKPASWLLVDGPGATLAEQDGAARLFTAQPTVARVVMYQDGSGFLLLRVTAGQPKPDVVPPPKPVDPPAPKPVDPPAPKPADDFTAKVQAAYAASTEPDKANTRQDLIALFTVAQKFAANPTVMGTGDLIAKLSQASDDFVGAGKLDAVRQIFADELQKAYPDDVPLDDAKRKAIAALFAKFAAALSP